MFTVKCTNCEQETEFTQKLGENGLEIVSDTNDIEIGFYNGDSGWYIKCNCCTREISDIR